MMPGRMNERQIRRMMQQAGIKSSDMDGVIQVDFIFSDRKLSVKDPQVTILDIQGTRTYQVVGGQEVSGEAADVPRSKDSDINEEDLNLVMQKTGVDRDKAAEALRKNGYKPAEAIIALMTGK